MKLATIASAAMAVAAVGLAVAPIASAGPEEDFLKAISDYGITWPSGKTQAVIDLGHAVCSAWGDGATLSKQVTDVQNAGWTQDQSAFFVGVSTAAFCPQYTSKIKSAS